MVYNIFLDLNIDKRHYLSYLFSIFAINREDA